MRDIGKNIKDLRTQMNMTQDELAEKLFVTRQTVSNYETGRSRPDVEMLMKIANVLDADIQELLYEPVSTGVRKRRVFSVLAIGACCLLLGLILNHALALSSEHAKRTFDLVPNIILGILIRPGYFLLLGAAGAVCVRILTAPRPLPRPVTRWLLVLAAGCVGFYLLCLFPWVFQSVTFPRFWFRLCNWFSQVVLHHFWLFLIPGGLLGLTIQQKKTSSE